MWETWIPSLGWDDPLEKGTATHSSILAWRIWFLYSPWDHKESDTTEHLFKKKTTVQEKISILTSLSRICVYPQWTKEPEGKILELSQTWLPT